MEVVMTGYAMLERLWHTPARQMRLAVLCVAVCTMLPVLCDSALAGVRSVTAMEYEIFTEAKRLVDKGRHDMAAEKMAVYFRRYSDRHQYAYELYGAVLLEMKREDLAVSVLREGAGEYADSGSLAQMLGTALYRAGKPLEAADAFLKAYALSGEAKTYLAYSAAVFLARGEQYGRAAAVLRPLTGRAEAKADWHILLAQCLMRQDKLQEAAQGLRAAVRVYPEDAKVWRMLGLVYYRQGLRDKAAATYEIAHKLAPPSSRESAQLASLYCSLGAPSLGARAVGEAPPTPEMLDNLAHSLARGGDLPAALEHAQKALEQAPTDDRRFRKGQILLRMEKKAEAAVVFGDLAAGGGRLARKARWMLAVMAWNDGNWQQARVELEKLASGGDRMDKRARRLLGILDQVSSGAEHEGRQQKEGSAS
jgi:tetratricopeptide (TPR) repeat protein